MDMTEGNIVRQLLVFALPMLIGNVFQQVYSMVDTMVAGYALGDSAIAAIGATASLLALIIDFAWGMNNGFALVVTRAFGSHDLPTLRRSIAGTMLLNTIVAVTLTVLSTVFLRPLMGLLNTPDTIFEQAHQYIFILCAGMISTIAYNMFAAILRAVGNSKTALLFLIVSNVTNIALDLLLVMGLRLGLAGAAIATVIGQSLSALLSGIYLIRGYKELLPTKEDFRLSKPLILDLTSNGLAMAFMLCVVDLGTVIFQSANNRLGDDIIAAYTVVRKFINIFSAPLGTLASASTTFIGQNYGARKFERIQDGLRKVIWMEVIWGLFSCALIYLFGRWMVQFATGTRNPDIIDNAVMSLRIHFPCAPALGILLALRTALQAMGQRTVPVLSSSIELGMKIVSALWWIPTYGFLGTSVTEPITWVLCMAFLALFYFKNKDALFRNDFA